MLLLKEKYYWQTSYVIGPGVIISLESLKRFDALTNEGIKQDFFKTGLYVVGPKRKQM